MCYIEPTPLSKFMCYNQYNVSVYNALEPHLRFLLKCACVGTTWIHAFHFKMSVKDQDIDSLKKTLRALLLSTKHGLTLQQLYNDYEMVIGQSVPYAKLGYRSFAELLRSMPDVVKSRRNSSGRELFEGIADPSSVHIASMVSKQRSTKRYCRLKSTQPVISNRLAPKCEKKCPPEVPMNVKIKLRQLLVSYPDGLPLSKFQDAYNKRFGYYLHTSTWGFKNLIEAFQSIDSIITLKCNSSQDDGEYILHIAKPGTKGWVHN